MIVDTAVVYLAAVALSVAAFGLFVSGLRDFSEARRLNADTLEDFTPPRRLQTPPPPAARPAPAPLQPATAVQGA